MEFLNINVLWNLIWIFPLFFILSIIAKKKRKTYLSMILGKRHSDPEYVNLSSNKRTFRLWILIIIIVFLTIAIARPYWGYKLLPFSGKGRDILAVLDVSKSMLSKDIRPSRLTHAKLLLKNLIKNTPGDRYGIIAFAGSAFLECPLTIDRTSLYSILKDINVDSIPVGGTNIEKALEVSINAFKAAAGGYKAIILITDGDELQGDSSKVISALKEIKTPLLVVGIGDPSKPGLIQLPTKDGQSEFLRDSKGNLVKSKLNETQLKQLADATNGVYIRSTAVDPGLHVLEKKIVQLIPEKYENGKMTRPLEKFQIFLLFAVLLIFIWLAVGELSKKGRQTGVKKKKPASANKNLKIIILLLSSITIGPSFIQADSNNKSTDQPSVALPSTISKTHPNTSLKTPNEKEDTSAIKKTPTSMFNMGVNAHKKGESKNADKYYTEAINLANKEEHIRSKAYQNMGVIQHTAARKIMMKDPQKSLQMLKKAENLYREAMRRGASRKEVAANQQILLNDKKKAEEIIKCQKEMQKKRDEAKKKTQEALNKQQQRNKDKQQQEDKNQNKKSNNKQKQDKQKNKEQKQENKEQKKKQGQQDKQQKQQQQNTEQQQREANRKTQEAQKAIQNYKESAKQNNSQKDMQTAQGASDDIKNARKNQQQNKTKKAEDDLKEALKKLSNDNQQKKQQKKQGQQNKQQDKQQKRQENKQQNQDKDDKQKKLPQQPKEQPTKPKYNNEEIDPEQAEALLKLMANDEKSLKKELKKRQKEAYGNMPIDKNW